MLVLRKIRSELWYGDEAGAGGDIAADPLGNLVTSQNKLSVWRIDSEESDVTRIIIAIASTLNAFKNIDYVLVDPQKLSEIGLSLEGSPGQTPYKGLNDRHLDIPGLSGLKLIELAKIMLREGKQGRFLEQQVLLMLREAVRNGLVKLDSLQPNLRKKLDPSTVVCCRS